MVSCAQRHNTNQPDGFLLCNPLLSTYVAIIELNATLCALMPIWNRCHSNREEERVWLSLCVYVLWMEWNDRKLTKSRAFDEPIVWTLHLPISTMTRIKYEWVSERYNRNEGADCVRVEKKIIYRYKRTQSIIQYLKCFF